MADGDAYVWGDNTCQVLGLTTKAQSRKRPFPVALLNKEHPSGYTRLLPKCQIVVAGGLHSVAVSVEGDIYTWGTHDEGQLGRNVPKDDDEAPAVPGKVTLPAECKGAEVINAEATDSATFALFDDGSVFGCGVFKDDGELGFSPDNPGRQHGMAPVAGPRAPLHRAPIESMAAGNGHVVLLTSRFGRDGKASSKPKVLTLGAGAQGQLGRVGTRIGPRAHSRTLLAPAAVRMPRGAGQPVAVFAGGFHTFVLTDLDKVVAFGLNNFGQLGLPPDDSMAVFIPKIVPSLSGKGITELACGEHHTVALTRSGHVLTFGRYAYGRLGRRTEEEMVDGDAADPTPTRVAFPAGAASVCSVAAGSTTSGAIDERGVLYMWGCGEGHMLGRGDDEDDVFAPEEVPVKEGYKHWQGQRVESCSISAQHVMIRATPGHDGA